MEPPRTAYIIFRVATHPDPGPRAPGVNFVHIACPLCGEQCWINGDRDRRKLEGMQIMCLECAKEIIKPGTVEAIMGAEELDKLH